MSPMDLLKKDHKKVRDLFDQFDGLSTSAVKRRGALFREIRAELLLHAEIEERVFYPAVAKAPAEGAERLVTEAREVHRAVRDLLEDLRMRDPDDPDFEAKMKVLREQVEHHTDEEEGVMFLAAKKLREEQLERLALEMESIKEEAERAA